MKNYKQFINENRAYGKPGKYNNMEFNFYISLSEATEEKQQLAFDEFKNYVDIEKHNIDRLLVSNKDLIGFKKSNENWYWYIKIYESWGNSRIPRTTIDFLKIVRIINSSSNDFIVSLDDFINIGLEGVEEINEINKNLKKFNL